MRDNIKTWLIFIALLSIGSYIIPPIIEVIIKIVFNFYTLIIAIILLIIYSPKKKQ